MVRSTYFPRTRTTALTSLDRQLGLFPRDFLITRIRNRLIKFIGKTIVSRPVVHSTRCRSTNLRGPRNTCRDMFNLSISPTFEERKVTRGLLVTLVSTDEGTTEGNLALYYGRRGVPCCRGFKLIGDNGSDSARKGTI